MDPQERDEFLKGRSMKERVILAYLVDYQAKDGDLNSFDLHEIAECISHTLHTNVTPKEVKRVYEDDPSTRAFVDDQVNGLLGTLLLLFVHEYPL